jgi:hypothetical protein
VEERSFHGSSRHLALLFAVAYCAWLLLVRRSFGKVGPGCMATPAAAATLALLPVRGGVVGWDRPWPAPHPGLCSQHSPLRSPLRSLQAPLPSPIRAQFPYPILNKLPFPTGFLGFVVLGFAVVLGTFQLGKAVKGLANSLFSGGSSSGGAGSSRAPDGGEGKKGR